jgi:hypothetical protein
LLFSHRYFLQALLVALFVALSLAPGSRGSKLGSTPGVVYVGKSLRFVVESSRKWIRGNYVARLPVPAVQKGTR